MGYSCGRAADDTLTIIRIRLCGGPNRNTWEEGGKKYLFELGKENKDGAITGSIWRRTRTDEDGADYYGRSSTFRIEHNGHLSRGPKSWKDTLKDREAELKTQYDRNRYVTREWRPKYERSEVLDGLLKEAATC